MSSPDSIRVSGLYIYPVKSCRGLSLPTAELDALGLVGDRRFLIVDDSGKLLTQRSHLAMIHIATALDATTLTLSHPGLSPLRVARHAPTSLPPPALLSVSVWGTSGLLAEDCGAEAAAWVSAAIGASAHLVRIGPAFRRPVGDAGDVTSFADGYPLLVISEASLADLNHRLVAQHEEPVPMNRFRPNLVVTGAAAFAEDAWPRVQIGTAIFRAAGPCARCIITTTDQLTGERSPEPLRTLASYRRDPSKPTDLNFGQNVINETKSASLRLGDSVHPIR